MTRERNSPRIHFRKNTQLGVYQYRPHPNTFTDDHLRFPFSWLVRFLGRRRRLWREPRGGGSVRHGTPPPRLAEWFGGGGGGGSSRFLSFFPLAAAAFPSPWTWPPSPPPQPRFARVPSRGASVASGVIRGVPGNAAAAVARFRRRLLVLVLVVILRLLLLRLGVFGGESRRAFRLLRRRSRGGTAARDTPPARRNPTRSEASQTHATSSREPPSVPAGTRGFRRRRPWRV